MDEQQTQAPVLDDMEKRTAQFIKVRDAIKALERRHKDELKPLKEIQEVLAGRIQTFMSANNLENLRTSAGTCYTTTRTSAALSDADAFMNFVTENQLFDLLDRRANVTAVKAFVKKNKALPPGCNLSTIATVGVKRAGATSDSDD